MEETGKKDVNRQHKHDLHKTDNLEHFFAINLDLICLSDTDGNIIKINEAWETTLGYKKEDLVNSSFLDFVHPDDVTRILEQIDQIKTMDKSVHFFNRYLAKDGSYRYMEWKAQRFDDLIYSSGRDMTSWQETLTNRKDLESFNKAILETTQDAFWVINEAYNFIEVNQAACQLTGYTKDELAKMTISDLLIIENPEAIQEHIYRIINGTPEVFETRIKKKDGTTSDVELSVACVNGVETLLICFARDITERKRVQDSLTQSRDMMSYVIEHNRSAVAVLDKHMNYMYVSKHFLDSYHISDRDVIGKNHYEIFPDLPQKWRDVHQRALNGEISSAEEDPYERSDGTVDWTRWECRPWYENDVSIGGVVLYTEVINDCKQAELVLHNERELFRTTLLSVGDGVISTNNKGEIIVMNAIAEKLTGWTKEEAIRRPLEEVFCIINEYTREISPNPAREVLRLGKTVEIANHTVLVSRNGVEIPIEDSASPVKNLEGKTTGVVIVFRDFTEKREKQKQVEYLSLHDHLTGLYNRRYMEDAIKRLDTERNIPLTVMMLDVNGLKLTNDVFGHEMGDQLLKTVADILRKVCRGDDLMGRVGGDEFWILLPHTDEREAATIKSRIIFATLGARLESVIVSVAVGYAVKSGYRQDFKEVMIEADNQMYKDKVRFGKTMRSQTVDSVLRNINQKYRREQLHTERVSVYSEMISRALRLDEREIQDIKMLGFLHNIGIISIPPELLSKAEKLSSEELNIIRRHPETGYQILKSVDHYAKLADDVLHHHERWDGQGYPEGLKGDDIPLHSRIIAVADSFEAMTSDRPYSIRRTKEEALSELVKCAGTQFDPEIVQLFIEKLK